MGTEVVSQRCSVKKMFLQISQIHRKTPAPEPLFKISLQAPDTDVFL